MNTWTTFEDGLTLYADFEFVKVSSGEPGGLEAAEGQEGPIFTPIVETSDEGLTDERGVYGTYARQVNTVQWIRGFDFVLLCWGWC